ncbi:MAG TPA: HAD domain-containing protein [Verrucomicrobiae bacterium]|jgi:hypothetical protein
MQTSDELIKAMKAADKAVRKSNSVDQIYGVRAGTPPIAPWPAGPCKILFLDIDGVLNSEMSARQFGTRYRFAKSSVEALNKILRQTDARFVITSSWREALALGEIVSYLERDGVLAGRAAGKTRILQKARGLEIDAWLCSVPYSVSSFAILDDRDDMEMHRVRLVQTDPRAGLGIAHAERAIELLTVPWKNN